MKTTLAYGDHGLEVDLPRPLALLAPEHRPGLSDPASAMSSALRTPLAGPPLRDLARTAKRAVISVCDVTRPQPRPAVLAAILDEISGLPAARGATVIVATGTHRASTAEERRSMLGERVLSELEVLDHDAGDDAALADLGRPEPGLPALVNRRWTEAELRISTGFVEPHLFAGFSGGMKMVAPGLAGTATVMALHDARRIASPLATWGVMEGNPVQEGIAKVWERAPAHFALDVTLNSSQEITGVFAGEVHRAHAEACEQVRRDAMRPAAAPFDVVVTSNSGYPLDQNLYQAVKGLSAAAQIVKRGGLIVCAAECRDGAASHRGFARLLASSSSPAELLKALESSTRTQPDQWQAQILARILQRARVAVYSDHLSRADLEALHLEAADDVGSLVRREMAATGGSATLCVLPQGPQTIPYLQGAQEEAAPTRRGSA